MDPFNLTRDWLHEQMQRAAGCAEATFPRDQIQALLDAAMWERLHRPNYEIEMADRTKWEKQLGEHCVEHQRGLLAQLTLARNALLVKKFKCDDAGRWCEMIFPDKGDIPDNWKVIA